MAIAYTDWIPVNCPQKGNISKVIINRTNDSIMFAPVYKTDDNGNNWYACFAGGTGGIFEIAPSNQNIIYTKEWKSIDGGESWFQISPIPCDDWYWQKQIAINPTNPDIVFSADYYNGIYRTTNGGVSWELVQDIYAFWTAYDVLTPSLMYSIVNYIVYKSTDGGNSWTEVYSISNSPYFCGNLIVSNHNLYCLMGEYIYTEMIVKSVDEGSSWSALNLNPENYNISVINDFCIANGVIYAATDKGLYSSNDDGITWERISADYDYLKTVDVTNKILIGSDQSGVSMSSLSADDWRNIGIGPLSHYHSRINTSSNGVTICNDIDGIYKLSQDTLSWHTIIPPIGSHYSYSIAVDFSPQNPNKIFTVLNDKLFISYDAGDDWEFFEELPTNINSNIISISYDESKLFFSLGSSLLRTLNSGASWSIKPIPGTNLYDLHYSNEDILYILDNTGYYYSANNGNTWNSLDSNLPYNGIILADEIYFDVNDNDRLFCNIQIEGEYDRQVYEKPSGSYEWSLVYTGTMLEEEPLILGKIVVEPNSSDLYGSGWLYKLIDDQWIVENWLFRSTDNGASWEQCSDAFNFYSYSNYTFSNYEPYQMLYIDENSNFWLGDVQNMSGVGIDDIGPNSPDKFTLYQNYPNPFNSTTKIKFFLKVNDDVQIKIYNLKGELVKTLISSKLKAGEHNVIWNGKDNEERAVSSGIYFYKVESGNFSKIKKMILFR